MSQELAKLPEISECIVHTGQHYDERMSQIFFDELKIPRPSYHLHVGSGSHGKQTGTMLEQIEQVLFQEHPDVVLVYGDTNSTLAGALAAVKLHIPIAHVEAGLRSFNLQMPEEINRILTDRISTLLFCPTQPSVDNLRAEGIEKGVHLIGDVMYDSSIYFAEQSEGLVDPLSNFELTPGDFILMTCHRAENTDYPDHLKEIFKAANQLADQKPVLLPLHPRTKKCLQESDLKVSEKLRVVEPISYLEMLQLEREAALILTDSGGVQKEAFIYGVPCVTMRDQTEWIETIDCGANILAGADTEAILEAAFRQLGRSEPLPPAAPFYGKGQATKRIATLLLNSFSLAAKE